MKPHKHHLLELKKSLNVDVFRGYRSNCDTALGNLPHPRIKADDVPARLGPRLNVNGEWPAFVHTRILGDIRRISIPSFRCDFFAIQDSAENEGLA
jgi:hypothetical protein